MRTITKITLAAMIAAAALGGSRIGQAASREDLDFWAQESVTFNKAKAAAAIQALRAAGPKGMRALETYGLDLMSAGFLFPETEENASWKRLPYAFEKVGAQRDNWASKLYWFTDLNAAKAEAKKENKPILSLRLLGNLDEELSCANSRFFRTALYPNANISKMLRENYILHWQSVRPVPKVTIDFGDGRKIQTTITGNSIHYVLDSQGRVLDALPGLYGPGAFMRWISRNNDLFKKIALLEDTARSDYLKKFHKECADQIAAQWSSDLNRASLTLNAIDIDTRNLQQTNFPFVGKPARGTNFPNPTLQESIALSMPEELRQALKTDSQKVRVPARGGIIAPRLFPTARTAAPTAATKVIAERRILERITVDLPRDRNVLKRSTTDELWSKIATLHIFDAKLDAASLEVLRTKTARPQTVAATFEKSVAEDTVRNEYSRHVTIHSWLVENPNFDLSALNKKVYSELFLTPDSDPWLGLLPADAYTAIENDGVSKQ